MEKIAILGSCVSREIFNYCKDNYEITTYIFRSPMETVFEKPIPIELENFTADSNFTRRMVFNEFNKKTFETIEKNKADYLMLDVSDCRFSIIEINLIEYITKIVYTKDSLNNLKKFIEKGILKNVTYSLKNVALITNDEWERYVDLYVKRILKIYRAEQIILNRVQVCTKYLDKDNNIQEFSSNDMSVSSIERIKFIEDLILQKLPGCSVIDNPPNMFANINHHLGLNPLHYYDSVYEYKRDQLAQIIRNKSLV